MSRRLYQGARVLFLILGLLGLALVALHTPLLQTWVLRTIVERGSELARGRLSIGSLDYRLWLGEFTVRLVRFEPEAERKTLASAQAEEVRVHWIPPARVEITAYRPAVELRAVPRDPNQPEDRHVTEPSVPSWISALQVNDAEIQFLGEGGENRVLMGPLDAELRADAARGARGTVHVRGGTVTFGDRSIDIRRVEAEALASGGDLELRARDIETEAGRIEGEGRIDTLSPFAAGFDLDFHLDAAGLGGVLLESPPEGIAGELEGSVRLQFAEDAFASEGEAEGSDLAFRSIRPFEGNARWDLQNDLLQVDGRFQQGPSRIRIEAVLDLERSDQTFAVLLSTPSLNAILRDTGGPSSPWDANLNARFSARMTRWSPRTLAGGGEISLSGDELAGKIDLNAEPGRILVDARELYFPGGRAVARARIADFDQVAAEYQLGIRRLSTALVPVVDRPARWLDGEVQVRGRAAGPIAEPASIRNSMRIESKDFRLRGEPFSLSAEVDQRGSALDFDRTSLAGNGTGGELSLSGEVDFGRRRMDVRGSLASFPVDRLSRVEGLSLAASGSLEARGSFDRPRGRATIDLSPLGYSDVHLPPVRLDLTSDGERAGADFTRLDSGESFAKAGVSLGGDYPLEGTVVLDALPWAELSSKLSPATPDATAIAVAGEARVRMSLLEPSRFEARAAIEGASVQVRDRTISTSAFELDFDREGVEVRDLELLYGGESLAVEGVLGFAKESSLDVDGNVALEIAEAWMPGRMVEGLTEFDLSLEGSLREPRLFGEIAVVDGRWIDAVGPGNTARGIQNLQMRAEAVGTRIEIETLTADVLGGEVRAGGAIPVPGAGSEETPRVGFDVSGIDVISLLGSARGSETVLTSISVGGEAVFPAGSFDRWEASGEIQEVLLASEGGVIYLGEPAQWSYDESGVELGEVHFEGERTDLRVSVEPPRDKGEESFELSLEGQADLQIVNAALPDSTYLSGIASLDVDALRSETGWRFSGEARVSEGALSVTHPAFAVTDLSASFALQGDRLRIENLKARAGGGGVTGEGVVAIPGAGGGAPELRLDLRPQQVRIEYPEGMRSEITSELTLESHEDRYRLSGKIDLVQAVFQRPISPERALLDSLRRQTLSLEGEPGLAGRVDLDLAVRTERAVVVDNNLGQMRWHAGMLVTGTLAAPEASGTLRAEPGGTLTFARNTYEIENARVALTTYPTEPAELEVRARTEAAGREIVLTIAGKTDNLRTTLESPTDPSLSRGDVAALLLTGRTLEEVRGEEADVLSQEAANYVGGSLASLTESGLASALPVSTVRLEPGLVGSETDPGVRFSLGRAITEDLFLTYSIGLDAAEEQLWIVDYDLPRRMKLRAIREDGNEYTGGLSQEAFFDFYQRNRPKLLDEMPKSKILAVEIEGEVPLSPEEISDALGLEGGDGYDYWKAREDADGLTEKLRARGFLSARVEPYSRPLEVEPGEPLTLVYEVDPGPEVIVRWQGDPVPADLRKWALERFEGYVPPGAQALRLARQLKWELMSRGYYSATVEPGLVDSDGVFRITFDVALGPQGKGVEIDIEGNDKLQDEEIERLLPPPGSPGFFELVLGRTEKLREELELLYDGEGYLESKVLELTTRFDPETSKLHVIIGVEEGERFLVGDLDLSGANSLEETRLLSEVQLKQGEPFQFLTHLQDRQRIASLYRREGFPDVRVRSSLQHGKARVDVIFEIVEGEPVRVGNVEIAGARATRGGVIRDAVTFQSGDPLRLSDLTETQSRLYNLRVFRSVDVRPEPTEEEDVRDVHIELTEVPDLRVGYGARYSTDDEFEATADLELSNLLGTARQLGFHAFANRSRTAFRGTFTVPSFFGADVGSNFYLDRETDSEEGFESRTWSITFQQGRRIFSDVLAQWSFTHRQGLVAEPVSSVPSGLIEADRSVLSFSLIEDTRSSLTRPRSGRFWNATLQFAPQFLGSDLRFLKLYGQLFLFRPLRGNIIWASSYRAGIANGFGQVLLPTDRFRAGGPSSVRGFPVNELGPADPITGTVIGGEGVVIMNQELRFPLFWRFGGIAFWDAGNVFLHTSDFNPLDLRHSSGLGLSVDLPVGLVTVDWAVLLNPPPELPRTRWHFTFGYSF